ncbi:hypothetical protein DUI87_06477 [Hirundo rustica rustica]|uniref:C-type lectin domain-containing protein n=1 Tax=Hirundo rustica rustica TaxID=333673 RepID=A0A3M0L0L9_HIRRU|nr:hypothetical protein DUI87_06477 [Hirundo rustica rustica]
MAQLYADLKFAKVMGGRSMGSQALEAAFGMNEAESPYENAEPGLAGQDGDGAEPSPGRWSHRWWIPVSLLATFLLLVATVALGACYWQVTRSLQDTSREHTAEQGRLSQELRAREQSLEQTQLELAWARGELQRAWHNGNITQLELDRLNVELRRVMGVLGKTEREVQEVQGRLNNSESTVALLRSCTAIDCCPSGWLLYRGKCLFISSEKKTWEDSRDECEKTYSQLLVTKSWSRWTVPDVSSIPANHFPVTAHCHSGPSDVQGPFALQLMCFDCVVETPRPTPHLHGTLWVFLSAAAGV